ncbi:unnamed protein product, partial [Leptidea sinapis]
VAWMHFEQSAILTVHNHVITRNPRVSVTHDKHRTWFLHISDVREEDRGRYMCQINTVTAKTQFGYLHVVVPPSIDDSLSSSDVIVREGANVTLSCRANGSPKPTIKWKRDDNSKISISKGHSEAHPTSLNYWTRDDGHMIHESIKYHMENSVGLPAYKTHMKLLIRNIVSEDYGTYKCVAKNPRGESD